MQRGKNVMSLCANNDVVVVVVVVVAVDDSGDDDTDKNRLTTTLTARNFAEVNELRMWLKDVARGEVAVLVALV